MPNNEKNAEPAVRDAQSTAARRRRRRHTPHGLGTSRVVKLIKAMG